ncbi:MULTISPECIES: hypothetical protein [Enterobacterales]|uniref:hypothetical protein n=1 Tax=Enterobacterales TaxID=91347 RepID=UPI002ED9C05C
MLISGSSQQNITFLGQNSHGSHEAWDYRERVIRQISEKGSLAVLVECPTVDLVLYAFKKGRIDAHAMKKYLSSSTYWWMRSNEFIHFMTSLPSQADIFGFDVPLTLRQHANYIKNIEKINFPESNVIQELLRTDLFHDATLATVSPEVREATMAEKVFTVINAGYRNIIVICHNFHATRRSWLSYRSLCERVIENAGSGLVVNSVAVFSRYMAFIATPDGHSLQEFYIENACHPHQTHWEVKMVSSFFRMKGHDSLSLCLNIPEHYDDVVVYDRGNPITIEVMNE